MIQPSFVLGRGGVPFLRLFVVLVLLLIFALFPVPSSSLAVAFHLTPRTSPESIVMYQLEALQRGEDISIQQVFELASPGNQKMTGPWERFNSMVRSPPYHYLVHHQSAVLLLTTFTSFQKGREVWSGLVRVIPESSSSTMTSTSRTATRATLGTNEDDDDDYDEDDDDDDDDEEIASIDPANSLHRHSKQVAEYWWYLSRCEEEGPHKGCYMVDSVVPN